MKDLTNKYLEVGEILKGRRNVLKTGAVLSAATLLAGIELPTFGADKKDDVKIANVALGLEHQAIAAYGAGAPLLSGALLDAAKLFLGQHEEHAKILTDYIKKGGGTPVAAKKATEYPAIAKAAPGLKSDTDVLRFALMLEAEAASTYISVLANFSDKNVVTLLAGIAADEAQHASILRFVLKENPCPQAVVK